MKYISKIFKKNEKLTKYHIFLSVLTSALLILSFPNYNFWFLAWIFLIPLFFVLETSSKSKSFILSYTAGLIFFGSAVSWLTYVTKLGYAVLVFILAFYFGLYGFFGNIILKRFSNSKTHFLPILLLPSLWAALEFARGILLTGFPWAILGYSQYKIPIAIQIAEITGAYGVSFVVVTVNFILYRYLSAIIGKFNGSNLFRKQDASVLKYETAATLAIVGLMFVFGHSALKKSEIDTGIKLSVAQGNISRDKKWDPREKDFILERYRTLTKEAAKDGSDIVVWPETSVPGFLFEPDIILYIENLIKEVRTPLLLGIVAYSWDGEGDGRFYNSASLFSADGRIEEEYYKIHLVPFGEYIPLERLFPFIRDFINVPVGDFSRGNEYTIFNISKDDCIYNYAALICFEDIFPGLVRGFVSDGADFLVNITNDAWFGESSEQLQHAQASVFRAVENRVSVVRAANTGFSCYISPKGIIEDSIRDKSGSMYIAGFKTFSVTTGRDSTFYTRFGDVFAYLCIFIVCAALAGKTQRHPSLRSGLRSLRSLRKTQDTRR